MNFLTRIFNIFFKIVRYENYLVFEAGSKRKVLLKDIPHIFYIDGVYYSVLSITDEIISKTLIRRWVKLEKI